MSKIADRQISPLHTVDAPELLIDPEITRYATMPAEAVAAELKRLRIDAQPTIDAVTRLVEKKLAEWQADAEELNTSP